MQRNKISFKGQRIFIGIDVHKDSWRVAVTPEVGTVRSFTQKPSAEALKAHLEKYYPEGEYLAVYETGFSGFSTHYALKDVGVDCIVTHAADAPTTQYEETMKSDKIDAVKLARSLKAGMMNGIYIHRKDDIDHRAVLRQRKSIQKQLAGCKAKVRHLLHSNGVAIPERFSSGNGRWSRPFIEWLRQEVRLLSATRDSLDLLLAQVELLRKLLLRATAKVRELSRSARYRQGFELLTSIPGIGTLAAMSILTEVGDFGRFRNERQFASYLGLVPTSHSSGNRVVHGEKTFRGNKKLGPMIIEAAWTSIRRDATLNCAYFNYKKRMEPQEAIVRVARRLSNIIFAVIKTGKRYEPFWKD